MNESNANGAPTFEQALSRIEEITELLASGQVAIDSAVALYREASDLLALCAEQIARAKIQIDEISAGLDKHEF